MPEKPIARKVAEHEEQRPSLKIDLRTDDNILPDKTLSVEENYRRRKEEVTRQDHEEFLQYQQEKQRQQTAAQARSQAAGAAEAKPTNVNRRSFLTVVAGTAAIGE